MKVTNNFSHHYKHTVPILHQESIIKFKVEVLQMIRINLRAIKLRYYQNKIIINSNFHPTYNHKVTIITTNKEIINLTMYPS